MDRVPGPTEEGSNTRRTLNLCVVCSIIVLVCEYTQEAGSEVRNVTGSIAVFCNQQLIGDLQAFLEWASQQYDYQDQRYIGCIQIHSYCDNRCKYWNTTMQANWRV